MKNLLLTLLLALIWTAVQGAFTLGNFVVGFALSYVALLVMQPLIGEAGFDARLWYQVRLVVVFFIELLKSSIRVAREAFTPGFGMKAGIIRVPLDVQSDLAITLFANLISLTPGTLSLDVATDRQYLYVHAISVETEHGTEVVEDIKNSLEKHVSLALGPRKE